MFSTTDDRAEDAVASGRLEPSYSFNVNDKFQLMAYSEQVFIGRVAGKVKNLPGQDSTLWQIEIMDTIKGKKVGGSINVRQLGIMEGVTPVQTDDQPLLTPGAEYMLATNPDGLDYVLVGGASSALLVDTADKKSKAKKEYTDAAGVK